MDTQPGQLHLDPRLILLKVGKPAPGTKPAPGKLRGTATVRVAFDLTIGKPYKAKIAAAVPWQRLAAVLMSKLNDASMRAAIKQAMDPTLDLDEIAGRAEAQMANLVAGTERECEGKVTGSTSIIEAKAFIEGHGEVNLTTEVLA